MDDSLNAGGESKFPLYISIAAVFVAIIAVFMAYSATRKAGDVTKKFEALPMDIASKADINAVSATASQASQTASQAASDLVALKGDVGTTLNSSVIPQLNKNTEAILALTSSRGPARAPQGGGALPGTPVLAGDEYVIKSGDSFSKIARAHGATTAAIAAVNPGVDSSKLKVGQKIKLPKK